MTDKLYLITEAQRDKQYTALENSIDAVTQEITDHKTMWSEEAIPSRAAQRQNLVLKERENKDAMEMLQSLPVVDTEPATVKKLVWSQHTKPNSESSYDHVKTVTPIGDFYITWKDWKENKQFDFECLGQYITLQADTLDDAKNEAQTKFNELFSFFISPQVLTPITAELLDDDEWENVWIECSDPQQDEIVMSLFAEKIQQAFCEKNGIKYKVMK